MLPPAERCSSALADSSGKLPAFACSHLSATLAERPARRKPWLAGFATDLKSCPAECAPEFYPAGHGPETLPPPLDPAPLCRPRLCPKNRLPQNRRSCHW